METLDRYLERKRRELEWLNARLVDPEPLPERLDAGEVVRLKLRLRARRVAEWTLANPDLTETNPVLSSERSSDPYTLRYRYQRYDLHVDGPCPYPGLTADLPLMRTELHASSGMGAIAGLVLALGQVSGPVRVAHAPDVYFETRRVLEMLTPGVRTVADPAAPRGEGTHVLWADSIEHEPPCVTHGEADLLVVDTTCWPVDDPRLRDIVAPGRLTALVRSHVKLDYLGIEYGRLGSLVLTSGPQDRIDLFRELGSAARYAIRTIGAMAIPAHLLPDQGDPAFHRMNGARLARVREANRRAGRRVAEALGEPVRGFHHELFFTVALGKRADLSPLAGPQTLVGRCEAADLPVRRANSFGFDFVAVGDFIDDAPDAAGIRVAMADWPDDLVDAFCEVFLAWHREAMLAR